MTRRTLWTEKYRPDTLSDVKGQDRIISLLQNHVQSGEIPHLLFSGPAGTGKTATAVAIAKDLFGETWQDNFLELNASDSRGIDTVRNKIKEFSRTSTDTQFRIIFLDESDALTDDAQAALRRTMEQFSENVRFIFSCNYVSQIIEPIQSRCATYRFTSLSAEAIEQHLHTITTEEQLSISDDIVEILAETANGDMRNAINNLQTVMMLDDEPTTDDVYMFTDTIPENEFEQVLEYCHNDQFISARDHLRTVLQQYGASPVEFLDQLYQYIWNQEIEYDATTITQHISETDYRITEGANPELQLDGLLSELCDKL